MTNIELFEKVSKELSFDRYKINCTDVINDLEKATLNIGTSDVGEIRTTDGVMHFSIGSEEYRVLRVGEGFQIFKNFITNQFTYTLSSGFEELIYYSNGNKLTVTDQNNTIKIRLLSDINPNDKFLIANNNVENYDTQDRKIDLLSDGENIRYWYFETYHVNLSSAPIWDYNIDTFTGSYRNWLSKGERNHGSSLGESIEEAKAMVRNNLIQNQTLEDINAIKDLDGASFVKRLTSKINNIVG